jgi:hypothetical protein
MNRKSYIIQEPSASTEIPKWKMDLQEKLSKRKSEIVGTDKTEIPKSTITIKPISKKEIPKPTITIKPISKKELPKSTIAMKESTRKPPPSKPQPIPKEEHPTTKKTSTGGSTNKSPPPKYSEIKIESKPTLVKEPEVSLLPKCKWGINCKRINPNHSSQYSHPDSISSPNQNEIETLRNTIRNLEYQLKSRDQTIEVYLEIISHSNDKKDALHAELKKKFYETEELKKQLESVVRKSIIINVPGYWEQTESSVKIKLDHDSEEFWIISSLMNSNIGSHQNRFGTVQNVDPSSFEVVNVYRNQCWRLWKQYEIQKQKIRDHYNSNLSSMEESKYLEKKPYFDTKTRREIKRVLVVPWN